ncbi:RDD family protein [Virgibacillus ainsalahensis]
MKPITKKRTKAYFIDFAISSVATVVVEYFLRKKVKNEVVHALITPTIVMWSLEYAQLCRNRQTIGYKKMGLVLENKEGFELTSSQIIKRMAYRDTVSSFDFLKNPKAFEEQNGTVFPHDHFSGTVVREN